LKKWPDEKEKKEKEKGWIWVSFELLGLALF
jgi:hypothetical protein